MSLDDAIPFDPAKLQVMLNTAPGDLKTNRLLWAWLSADASREALYAALVPMRRSLVFRSRANAAEDPDDPARYGQDVVLLTHPDHLKAALTDTAHFSNSPYRKLGSGSFMLGLDGPGHHEQRVFMQAKLAFVQRPEAAHLLGGLCMAAWQIGSVLALKDERFDLPALAEQVALRFGGLLFGYGQSDNAILQFGLGAGYRRLNFEIAGKHFEGEPAVSPLLVAAAARLMPRTVELIDLYGGAIGEAQNDQRAELDKQLAEVQAVLPGFQPVLRQLAAAPGRFDANELAVMAAGTLAGLVGNVQAGVSNTIGWLFEHPQRMAQAVAAAGSGDRATLGQLICQAMRHRPAAAFLARRTLGERGASFELDDGTELPCDTTVLLAMGAPDAAMAADNLANESRGEAPAREGLMYGWTEANRFPEPDTHECIGRGIGRSLITTIVSQVLKLPGLAERYQAGTGHKLGVVRQWGAVCTSYPLRYARAARLVQQPLSVVMSLKAPVNESAAALKRIIANGAPKIEFALRDSKHVHFAWFVMLEGESKLALFTTYDGAFDEYVEHFGLKTSELFDRIFEHIDDAPPLPVARFPKEFVAKIKQYNQRPAEGYFFSAYPDKTVGMINPPAAAGAGA